MRLKRKENPTFSVVVREDDGSYTTLSTWSSLEEAESALDTEHALSPYAILKIREDIFEKDED